jgi:hypothetical protein
MPGPSSAGFGDDDERARSLVEREAEHARIYGRYARHLAKRAGIDEPAARRVVEVLWSEAAAEVRKQYQREERAIAAWLSGQRGVEARRITSLAPGQWEGSVDGHPFCFRERGGCWRLELGPAGGVIAEGAGNQLGTTPTEHIAFIVAKIRDHLLAARCDHAGALSFCPQCGHRMDAAC